MKKRILFTILAIISGIVVHSQTIGCLKDFDYLVAKIKADYPGYNDKVTNINRAGLLAFEEEIKEKIKAYPDSCFHYLNQYAGFFKDHHVRVGMIRKGSTDKSAQPEIMQTSSYGKNAQVNIDSLQQKTTDNKGIEGVWMGFGEEFAIYRDKQTYIAVAVNCPGWQKGQVLYEFTSLNDTLFTLTHHTLVKDKKTYTTKASLHLAGKILEFHDMTRFVRKSKNNIADKSLLSSYTPMYPNGRNTYPVCVFLSDSTYYLRIPLFYSNLANEFVEKHWNDITTRPNLIIDIRNNGGGQDVYYQQLAKLMYTKPYESKGVEWYASKGNIALFEDAIRKGEIPNGEEGLRWTQALVAAMKKNEGGFVTHPDQIIESDMVTRDTVYPVPRHVGIIMNEGNASSAEQFLLTAKSSDKVILFGTKNTAGVLDYSNVTSTPLPSNNYQLECPMTRSKRLPENPIDNIGIAPDIIIPFPETEQLYDRLDSWVYFVKNYLELLNQDETK